MSPPLLILHLSDLHFGPNSRFANERPKELAARLHDAIEEARTKLSWAERVSLCIVTGDIAEAARPREYTQAREFFEALTGDLGLTRPRVIFVPGNHDVSWSITKKLEIDKGDEGFDAAELERRIQNQKFERFEKFLREFYGKDRSELDEVQGLGLGAYVHTFTEDRLVVAVLNSCERESHLRQGGVLSTEQAQALMNQWRHDDARHLLKIVAVHHNPMTTVTANVTAWVEHLKREAGNVPPETLEHFRADTFGFEGHENLRRVAEDCHVQLVLHGHHHASQQEMWAWKKTRTPGHTLVLSAGSWGYRPDKLPAEQPNMMHLVRLAPASETAWSVLLTYEPRARTEGHVQPGQFVVDPATAQGVALRLSLPETFERDSKPKHSMPPSLNPTAAREFIWEYRTRVRVRYERLDLSSTGTSQRRGTANPLEATLDDMYLPLRLAKGYDPDKSNAGTILEPADLLARESPIVIRGAAGSGKTTWMRWTFRQLVRREDALPFMVELRRLAKVWKEQSAKGAARTFGAYLYDWVAESGVGGWKEALPEVLNARTGPRPVLLVDGWDELGSLGEELRDKLREFLAAHPRVLAVVSSRPYGDTHPSRSEGFEILDLQPLSNAEIQDFTQRFQQRVYSEDVTEARESGDRFVQAVHGSPGAADLARIPLLLTMMLLISRDRALPDKRHRLYDECLKYLLSARPGKREVQGALLHDEQWRPEDSAERFRTIAELAFRLHSEHIRPPSQSLVVSTRERLAHMLPGDWHPQKRSGFLEWLVGAAGVLVDRADGTLSFAHLSFQEYLTAHHIAATVEGEASRLRLCLEKSQHLEWWESLRLWAAIVGDDNPALLTPVLSVLINGEPAAYWLAGAIFADGFGQDTDFQRWCAELPLRFHVEASPWFVISAYAWRMCQQNERRQLIEATVRRTLPTLTWFSQTMSNYWHEIAGIQLQTESALDSLSSTDGNAQTIGRGRALLGSHPLWPEHPLELVFLRLLPTPRSYLAMRLQILVSFGASLDDIRPFAKALHVSGEHNDWRDLAESFAKDAAPSMARILEQSIGRDLARDVARDLAQEWVQDLMSDFDENLSRGLRQEAPVWAKSETHVTRRDWARDWARDLLRRWLWRSDCFHAKHDALELAMEQGRDTPPSWLIDYLLVDRASLGRTGTRAMFARSSRVLDPRHKLLQLACHEYLNPATPHTDLNESLASYSEDPLWSAEARFLARRATTEDKALLIDLIAHPEKRPPPIAWGLKYYLRGDIVLDDGRELLLDDVCDQLGIPRQSYLADMPPNIMIDWEKE